MMKYGLYIYTIKTSGNRGEVYKLQTYHKTERSDGHTEIVQSHVDAGHMFL